MADELVCVACGGIGYRAVAGRCRSGMCMDCGEAHMKEQAKATRAVRYAVARGSLQKASEFACVDCGKPACDYDHRDYTKPLDVVPVCRSCNQKRGPAFNSFYRPSDEQSPFPQSLTPASHVGAGAFLECGGVGHGKNFGRAPTGYSSGKSLIFFYLPLEE